MWFLHLGLGQKSLFANPAVIILSLALIPGGGSFLAAEKCGQGCPAEIEGGLA